MSACFQLPPAFRSTLRAQGVDAQAFEDALAQPTPTSLRLNRGRTPTAWAFPFAAAVPWCPQGRYLETRPQFTLDPLFHAGAYYVQEASSMLLWHFVQHVFRQEPPVLALDLCAAPGGKSTLLADALPAGSELVSNEVIATRATLLKENILRWGAPQVRVCQNDPEEIARLGALFDLVVVDAPCSGEGLWRKQADAVQEWSTEAVAHCAARQSRILAAAWQCLKPGGLLIYSTCTYNDSENIGQLAQLVKAHTDAAAWRVEVPADWGFVAKEAGDIQGWQAYPHRVQGEGFFIGALQKAGAAPATAFPTAPTKAPKLPSKLPLWLTTPANTTLHFAADTLWALPPTALPPNRLRWLRSGIQLATAKGKDWIPTHEVALLPDYHAADTARTALSKDQALQYLKGEDPAISHAPKGWVLATYLGVPLGWLKHLGNRSNNALPKSWRIRQDLSKLAKGAAKS